jgi:ketosteroid isomerase-like protein
MSRENVEIVRSWYEPDRFADAEWIDYMYEDAWDPNIDWRAIEGAPDDIGPILGRDAMRAYYEDWQATFDEITLEAEEVIEAPDDTAVAVIRVAGRAKLSGVRAELRHAVVFTLRDGKVIRGREYATRAEALEAVGLAD